MTSIAGKKLRLKVSSVAGGASGYAAVAGLDSVNLELDGTDVDDGEFADWAASIQGQKHIKVSASGKYRPSDTTGQAAILSAFLNDTELWMEVLPDNGTTSSIGFKVQVGVVSKFAIDAAADGKQGISIELVGTGTATQV